MLTRPDTGRRYQLCEKQDKKHYLKHEPPQGSFKQLSHNSSHNTWLPSHNTKHVFFIKLTAPRDIHLKEAFERKLSSWRGPLQPMQTGKWKAKCLPVEVGSTKYAEHWRKAKSRLRYDQSSRASLKVAVAHKRTSVAMLSSGFSNCIQRRIWPTAAGL